MSFDFNLASPSFDDARFKTGSVKDQVQALTAYAWEVQQLLVTAPQWASLVPEEHQQGFEQSATLPLEVVQLLMPQRQAALDEWWAQHAKLRYEPLTLAAYLVELIQVEARLKSARYSSWKAGIEALVRGEHTLDNAVYLVTGETRIRLPGVVAFSHDMEADPSANADFLVYSLASGYWFDNSRERAAAQVWRAFVEANPLRSLLSIDEQAAVDGNDLTLDFVPLDELPHSYLINDLQAVQRMSAEKYMSPDVDDVKRIARLDHGGRLAPLAIGLQRRAVTAMRKYRFSLLPDWRRHLEGEELVAYQQLEGDLEAKQARCASRLDAYRSLPHYAHTTVQAYIQNSLGLEVEPEKIQLRVIHLVEAEGVQPSVIVRNLLDWVLSGGYSGSELQVEVVDERYAALREVGFIQSMIVSLDIRTRFVQSIEGLYENEQTKAAMDDVIDARLALAGQAARHQGLEQAAFDLLDNARNGDMQAHGIAAALVCLNDHDIPLKDMLCLHAGDCYLLYAPGAPGADMQAFNSIESMALAIGSWTITPMGSEYLLDQCSLEYRAAFARHLRKVEMLPTDWSMHAVVLQPIEAQVWQGVIDALGKQKIMAMLEHQQATTPAWYIDAEPAQQQALADIDQLLEAVQAEYRSIMPMPRLRPYAHGQVKASINAFPGNTGGEIDPDTVLVELEPDAIRSLTITVLKGYPASFNFADFARIRSSVGQDITHLTAPVLDGYIRSARLGEKYIAKLQETFLDPARPEYALQRQWHRKLLALKIKRDLLGEKLKGTLSVAHAQWLEPILDSFASTAIDKLVEVYQLKVAGCLIAGAYLLLPAQDESLDPLVYLPEVTHGPTLRSTAHLAEDWREHDLDDYFYERVALSKQPKMGSFIEKQLRAGDGIDAVLQAIGKGERILDLAHEFDARIQRLLDEADEDTDSVAERLSGMMIEWVIVAAGILAIPFPVAGMVLGVALAARSLVQGVMAWIDGDRAAALSKFAQGLAGLAVSSGAVTQMLAAAQRYVAMLAKVTKEVASPSRFVQMVTRMSEELVDASGEIFPAVYDGFGKELLWLIEDETAQLGKLASGLRA
jgi:hypothetical protein